MSIQSSVKHRRAVAEMLTWLRKSDGPGFMMVVGENDAVGLVICGDMKRIMHGVPYENGYLFT